MLLAIIAFAAAACGDSDPPAATPTSGPPTEIAATPTAAPPPTLEWEDCDDGFECATMPVPLDHDDPSGETIDLALIRYPAEEPDERIGSLIINPGGPGGSGIEFVRIALYLFPDELTERFDIVSFDPRGVGASEPVDCGSNFDEYFSLDPTPDDDAEKQALVEGAREYAAGCEALSADILPHVDTVSAARDMDILRAALGEEKLTYIGYSYGTFLGATYAGLFPQNIRALVLDGAIDPSLGYEEQVIAQALGFEQALDAFFEECGSDSECPFYSGGDPASAYDEVMAAIEREPLPAESIGDLRPVGPGYASIAVISALYDQEFGWAALADALDEARDGDGSGLLLLFDDYVQREEDGTYSSLFEANAAVNCLDIPAPTEIAEYDAIAAELRARAPRLGIALAYGFTCAEWPVPPTGTPAPIAASGAPPILVVGTTGDSATPYEHAVALAQQLDSGVLLTWEGEGHTTFGAKSACIDEAVAAYLIDLTVPADGTRCD